MISFSNWLLQRESSPHTRARAAAAQGLLPMATVGSIHGRSTASPFQVKQFKKKLKKKKTKKKIDETPAKNTQVDSWIKETDKLKDDLERLKDVFQKHKGKKPEEEKPEKEKPDEKDEKTEKPESDDTKLEKGKKKDSEEEEEVIE